MNSNSQRQQLMAVLAKAEIGAIEDAVGRLGTLPDHHVLR